MKKFHLLLTLVALSLATTSIWATPSVAVNGKLPGAFSVACGEYVYFSQGNLQYRASTNTWRFAEEQYSYVGNGTVGNVYVGAVKCNNANISQTYTGWIDLFAWASSGNSASGTFYQPWETTYNNSSDIPKYGSANPTSGEWISANSDWGQNMGSGWRTLTASQWQYLYQTRATGNTINGSSNARFTHARILTDGTGSDAQTYNLRGLILFPDGYTGGTPTGVIWGDINRTSWSNDAVLTTCTTNGWKALEAAGCVFLPLAGARFRPDDIRYFEAGGPTLGLYWSSTSKSGYYARAFEISHNGTATMIDWNRNWGLSVRLVQDVDPAIEPTLKPKASVTSDPVGKTNMTYTGSSQTLLESLASGATGGTVKYRVGTSGSWGTATSYYSATNAGDYIVQWFVDHTGNSQCYVSSDVQEIHVTIKRRATSAPSPKPTIAAASSLTYNGSAQDLVTTTGSIQSGYTAVYSTDGVNWSTTIPQETNAGDYTVYYKFYKGNNEEYVPSPNTINASIAQADLDLSGVALPGSTSSIPYDGTEKTLLEIEDIPDCTVWYKLGDGEWTTTPPTETDANAYSVQYKIVPSDPNYKTYGPNTVTVTIMDYPTVSDHSDATTIATVLNNLADPWTLKVARTIYANDEYNTICLPFSLDASALAASPLAGFNRLKTLRGAKVTGIAPDLSIDILVEDATTIEAGIPYLISYPSAHADIVNPVFENVTETTTTPSATSADGVTFQGMFAQVHIDPYASERDEDYLFLGANSQLMWPASSQTDSSIKMRGFRAYFIIDRSVITPALAPKGTRARIVDAPKTATGIDDASAKFGESQKILGNGILYIIRNGVRYNAQGQIVK